MSQPVVGIVGGSGLYDMEGLVDRAEHWVTTPFGDPSDAILAGTIGETRFLFLPRHGRGHRLAPHEINYRANILALKQLGATQIISISAVGSLQERIRPGDVVLVDQFIDRTRSRPSTFFEGVGVVAHVEFADPIDAALQDALYRAAIEVGAPVHRGGTYVCIEGPQFSTRAESELYRSWGATVVGMTNLPEARLAREAELPYATIALVTDYDGWRREKAAVSVDAVLAVLKKNVGMAQAIPARGRKSPPGPRAQSGEPRARTCADDRARPDRARRAGKAGAAAATLLEQMTATPAPSARAPWRNAGPCRRCSWWDRSPATPSTTISAFTGKS